MSPDFCATYSKSPMLRLNEPYTAGSVDQIWGTPKRCVFQSILRIESTLKHHVDYRINEPVLLIRRARVHT